MPHAVSSVYVCLCARTEQQELVDGLVSAVVLRQRVLQRLGAILLDLKKQSSSGSGSSRGGAGEHSHASLRATMMRWVVGHHWARRSQASSGGRASSRPLVVPYEPFVSAAPPARDSRCCRTDPWLEWGRGGRTNGSSDGHARCSGWRRGDEATRAEKKKKEKKKKKGDAGQRQERMATHSHTAIHIVQLLPRSTSSGHRSTLSHSNVASRQCGCCCRRRVRQ